MFKKYRDSQYDNCSEQGESIRKQMRQEKQVGSQVDRYTLALENLHISEKQWEH